MTWKPEDGTGIKRGLFTTYSTYGSFSAPSNSTWPGLKQTMGQGSSEDYEERASPAPTNAATNTVISSFGIRASLIGLWTF